MFLSLCAEREFGQLGWNGSKKALSEEPERFDSFLTFFGQICGVAKYCCAPGLAFSMPNWPKSLEFIFAARALFS